VLATVVLLVISTAVLLGYPVAFETLWRGRTPGKAALGLRVVTKEGAPVRFRHAAVRGFVGLVDFYVTTGAAAVIAVLITRDNQRLGDLAAGTLVLRERSGAGRARAVRFGVPPGYEGYAATLDTAGLRAEDYAAVRSFLMRAGTLPAHVRADLGAQVADAVAARLHHRPPPGVTAEAFLACAAAAFQHRSASASAPAPAGTAGGPAPQTWAPAAAAWAVTGTTRAPAPVPPAPPDGGSGGTEGFDAPR